MNKTTRIFEQYRPVLFRLAYGMLGRAAPAEDAVQETYIRWQKQDINQIRSPKAWLSKVLNRICLDEIKSARVRKETYVGPDLPEPILTERPESPEMPLELAESLSMALLVVLDRLTPVQRAVFLLRDAFDYEYASISDIIDKPQSNCRKIAQRARHRIRDEKPPINRHEGEKEKLLKTFVDAIQKGDIREIESVLAEEAILYSDGGGKVTAARKPVSGANNIARFLAGIRKKTTRNLHLEFTHINGTPGVLTYLDKELNNVWSFRIENEKIQSLYVVLNPDKLTYVKKQRQMKTH